MLLRAQIEASGDVFIVRCDGRIVFGDEGTALRERIRNLTTGTPKVVINLSGVEHIDSEGLGMLVGLFISARNRGGELKLVSPNKHVHDALHRTSLDRVFGVYGNDEEAVTAFRDQGSLSESSRGVK